jgi:regulator of PEP synthase PpsR (kinase-PPPase family)
MKTKRSVFFVSDGTAITAETVGHSLLSQFEGLAYRQFRIPFVDTPQKAADCLRQIEEARRHDGIRPIVISTLVNESVVAMLQGVDALVLDFFGAFISPLEAELGQRSSHAVGKGHGRANTKGYAARIDAINFTLAHDDGVTDEDLDKADIILVGVSRSGKTPTSLYLAMQFGIRAANYPLIPEDFERQSLPAALSPYGRKLFGLSISPERLARIRQERRPGSRYASLDNCRWEIQQAEKLMRREGIAWLDSTAKSIEEISATLLQAVKLDRQAY